MFRKNDMPARPRCACVLVAAGSSSRMGGDKLAMKLAGRTVLERSVAALDGSAYIDEIVIVTQSEKIPETAAMARDLGYGKVNAWPRAGNAARSRPGTACASARPAQSSSPSMTPPGRL